MRQEFMVPGFYSAIMSIVLRAILVNDLVKVCIRKEFLALSWCSTKWLATKQIVIIADGMKNHMISKFREQKSCSTILWNDDDIFVWDKIIQVNRVKESFAPDLPSSMMLAYALIVQADNITNDCVINKYFEESY